MNLESNMFKVKFQIDDVWLAETESLYNALAETEVLIDDVCEK